MTTEEQRLSELLKRSVPEPPVELSADRVTVPHVDGYCGNRAAGRGAGELQPDGTAGELRVAALRVTENLPAPREFPHPRGRLRS